jgi:1-deoxy-D-xylulose-5-phosphate reductoisomerase
MTGGTRRLLVLGSTGSIGRQTVEVVTHLNALAQRAGATLPFEIVGLAAGSDAAALGEQASSLGVRELALASGDGDGLGAGSDARVRTGEDAAAALVDEVDADLVMAAIVGAAGLPATFAALRRGIDVALANKEVLVAAGELAVREAAASGAAMLPVDSEHAALWMCLASSPAGFRVPPYDASAEVERIVLTASGGALIDRSAEELRNVTAQDALKHPNWDMGAKVTIDTATLMNKSFELVEAHWLFGMPAEKLSAVVHRQSIVHAIAEFADGSSVAQLGLPDMRTPIQFALTAPERPAGLAGRVSLASLGSLTFEEPDSARFPAIGLGGEIVRRGGSAGAVVNAANEEAVRAFCAGRMPFPLIYQLTAGALDRVGVSPVNGLDDVLAADAEARRFVASELSAYAAPG